MVDASPSHPSQQADDGLDSKAAREREVQEELAPLIQAAKELLEYASHYGAARLDLIRLQARGVLFKIVAIAILLQVGVCALAIATYLTLRGLSSGLGEWFSGRVWLGELITGGGLLLFVFTAYLGVRVWTKFRTKQFIRGEYDRRRKEQHAAFGHDVGERARSA